jgi:iron complex outermembrane receptor protein
MRSSSQSFSFSISTSFFKVLSVCLALFLYLPVFALAQDNTGQTDKQKKNAEMQEVVVTASRYAEEVSRVPANVTVITEKDIKNSTATNVPDLLRSQAGVQVSEMGNRTYTVDLRGFGETAPMNSVVMVDGRRVTQADLSGTDWTQIPIDRVKRIEIVRGGRGAVLYGDNATGGVINIITKEGERNRAGIDAAGGSFKTFKGGAFAEGRSDRLAYAVNANYFNTDGYRLNSKDEATDLGANLKFYPEESTILSLSSGFHKDSKGLPGALKESDLAAGRSRKDSIYPDDYADTIDQYVKGGMQKFFLGDNYFNLDASIRTRDFTSYASYVGGNFTGKTSLTSFIITPQVVLVQKPGGMNNKLTFGMDYLDSQEGINNTSLFFGFTSTQNLTLEKSDIGYYVLDELELVKGLTLSGGYRMDKADYSFTNAPGASKHEHAWTAGVNYNYNDRTQAYFNFARTYRYPALDELFSFFTNTVLLLDPQDSKGYELGAKHFILRNLMVGVNLFSIKTQNEIYYNPYTYANQNLDGDTSRQGAEGFMNWSPYEWLSVFGNYTYTHTKIKGGMFDGKHIPGVPEKKYSLGVALSPVKPLVLSVTGTYVGSRPYISDFQNTFADQDSYYFVNAKVQYKWKWFSVFASVNNLTDKKYSDGAIVYNSNTFTTERGYYPAPTINFLAGLTAEI